MSALTPSGLPAGTHPLPYLQVGMLLRRHYDEKTQHGTDVETWRVHELYEVGVVPSAHLTPIGNRFFDKDLPISYVLEAFTLAEDFSPLIICPSKQETKNTP